jgi:hypothetical protein
MVVVRKIFAVVAMILCTGILLVCLAGGIGVWIARAPLTHASVALLTTGYDTLQRVETTAGQISQGLEEIQALAGKVDDAVSGVSAAAGVLKQIGPVGDALDAIEGGVQQLDGRLAGLQASVSDIQSQAAGLASRVDAVTQRIPAWISIGAFAITLGLLWIGLGQVSLFLHALAWFRRPSPVLSALAVTEETHQSPDEPAPLEELPPPAPSP